MNVYFRFGHYQYSFYVNCVDDIFYRSIAILHTMGERITSTIEWFLLVECCEEFILQKFIAKIPGKGSHLITESAEFSLSLFYLSQV